MRVFFIPVMIIMKIECTIPGKTSLLEFALFIKFIISHKRRQDTYLYDFFSLFLGVQSAPEVGPTSYETPYVFHYGKFESAASFETVERRFSWFRAGHQTNRPLIT